MRFKEGALTPRATQERRHRDIDSAQLVSHPPFKSLPETKAALQSKRRAQVAASPPHGSPATFSSHGYLILLVRKQCAPKAAPALCPNRAGPQKAISVSLLGAPLAGFEEFEEDVVYPLDHAPAVIQEPRADQGVVHLGGRRASNATIQKAQQKKKKTATWLVNG